MASNGKRNLITKYFGDGIKVNTKRIKVRNDFHRPTRAERNKKAYTRKAKHKKGWE